jgi:hypothetical protein
VAFDGLRKAPLPRTLADALGDFADLVSKQIQLARAEMTANISSALFASAWVIVAALLFLLAGVLLIEGAVFALASMGIALYWSCCIVAAVLAVVGAGLFIYARSAAQDALTLARSIRQINKNVHAAKEQLR